MKQSLLFLLFLFSLTAYSQSAKDIGLQTINKQSAEAYISFLASDALEGRQAGHRGGRIAAEYIASQLKTIGVPPFRETYFQHFEAYKPDGRKRYSVNPDSIAKWKVEKIFSKIDLQNVFGFIEGKNNLDFVIVGAHYDHLGIGEAVNGDSIYNGADDNASGVSAVLQIAKAFIESGQQPERTIVFAFWDGEESGLLGSEYFMLNHKYPSAINAYLNFDMIGRNNNDSNPEYVVFFYTESHPAFGEWLRNDISDYELGLKPNYRPWDKPVSGSDNGSFAKRGVPILWYHTDGHPDYHKPSDHVEKINWDKLVDITKAAYLNVWNLANLDTY
ncbi:MAG: M28 family metallopeptidase [Dysgonomonas sp.]